MSFADYSTTPGDNTVIAGRSIAPGGPPSTVGPGIRQLMADGRTLYDSVEAVETQVNRLGPTTQFYPGARSYVPQGATGHGAITGGSGGTNGTFALAFTGGNFNTNPAGTFTVVGGAVTSITLTGPGLYIGGAISAPTLVFTASGGLTGASAALETGYLVGAGEYYLTDHATDPEQTSRFQNQANAAVEVDASVDYLNTALIRGYTQDSEAAAAAAGVSQAAAEDAVSEITQVERGTFPHFKTAPVLNSTLLRVGTPYIEPAVNGVTITLWPEMFVQELGRRSDSGGQFRVTIASRTGVTDTQRIGVSISGGFINPTGYTGWKAIPLVTIDSTSFPGIANGTQIGYLPIDFGDGANFGGLGSANYYTYAQSAVDVTFLESDEVFEAKSANITTEALALVNQYYRSWARNTVTDRNLLGMVDDAVVEQGTPGRDYVIRYEKIAFPGIPLWRTRWFLYDTELGRDVTFWAYSSPSDPTATLESLYRPIFLADAALGSVIGPDYDAVVAKLSIESWYNAPWTIALTTTTDPAEAGINRDAVVDGQSMQDRFCLGSQPKRLLTYGNAQADYVSLTALVVALRDPAIGSYTYSDWPTSFCSFSHQVEAVCVQTGYEEDLNDLVIPRFLTVTGIGDTLFTGVTTRVFELSFSGRFRRCRMRIDDADKYLGHIDNSNGLSKVSADGVLRHFETYIFEDCKFDVGPDQNVSVFGCGMENNSLFRFVRCIIDVDVGNTSAYPIFLIHSNPNVTRPGRLEIEDTTILKRNRTGPDVFLQSLQAQAQRNIVVVKNSDVDDVVHEYGSGVSVPAWQRRGKLSVTSYSPELDPA